jgi:hypothetical protein
MPATGIKYLLPTKYKGDLYVDQANPVSGTKYEWSTTGLAAGAAGTKYNVRLIAAFASVTWTVQPTPLEVHVTVDGETFTAARANPASTTPYYLFPSFTDVTHDTWNLNATAENGFRRAFLLDARSLKLEAETTGGTSQALNLRVLWCKF